MIIQCSYEHCKEMIDIVCHRKFLFYFKVKTDRIALSYDDFK